MSKGEFRKGPFLFESETDEDLAYPIIDPFSLEPAQMVSPEKDVNRPSVQIEKLAQEVKPSYVFRFLDYLYSKGDDPNNTSSSTTPPAPTTEVRRHGKLNWDI